MMKNIIKGIVIIALLFINSIAFTQVEDSDVLVSNESTMILNQGISSPIYPLSESPTSGVFFQVFLSLLAVSILIYGFIRLLRKLSGRTSVTSSSISVVSSHTLTPATSVHIVDIEGELYILGCGDTVNLLAKLDDQEKIDKIRLNAEKAADAPLSFVQLLSEKLKKEHLQLNKPARRQFMAEQVNRLHNLAKEKDSNPSQQEEQE